MKAMAPEGFEKRRPGAKHNQAPRVGLVSLGPFHEISADGHERLNAQAPQMGNISIPIYGYRDKYSGFILKMTALPDSRSAAPLAHLYLDLIDEYMGTILRLPYYFN